MNILNLWNCTRKSIRIGQPKRLKKILEFKFSWNEKKAYSILILQINSAWRTELFVKKYRTWCNSSKNIVTFNCELLGLENRKVYLNVSNPNVFLNGYIQVADIWIRINRTGQRIIHKYFLIWKELKYVQELWRWIFRIATKARRWI